MQPKRGIQIGGETIEAPILNVTRESVDLFELIKIETSRGIVECRYYKAGETNRAVIMVGGIGGGFDTPAGNLYPWFCSYLNNTGISALRVKFRYPTDLSEAVIDVLVGIEFLKTENVNAFGLVGHSFGGAVVIQAAAYENEVKTVVTLATQSYGISPISLLPESTSILLIHGNADETLPAKCSMYAYNLAHEPKKIKIYENVGHSLNEVSDEIYNEVKQWLEENLR